LAKHSARATAARIITLVLKQQQSLNAVLRKNISLLPENERALCQQLCYGVIRWQLPLQAIADQLIAKPLKNKDADIAALLLCGLYQLRSMRLPEHAALSETVNSCKTLGKPWAKGLINASLRNYQRNKQQFEAAIAKTDKAHYAHPKWILNQLQKDWPEDWQSIVEANNQQAPMMLRVNRQQYSRDEYLKWLQEQGFKAKAINGCVDGIELDKPCDVNALPGFFTGAASVQDGAAQHTVELLGIKQNQRILDACAAPGGKTCHILEVEPTNDVVAIDIDAERLLRIKENTQRLDLSAELIAADAGDIDAWWDKKLFDRILIDAPCSGTGVIRRHPDIKVLRRPEDLQSLVNKQQQLLENLWPLLNTGGLIVYTTCSVFKQENELQVMNFLQKHPEAEEIKRSPPPASPRPVGYQRLPGEGNMDGFYYVCIRKI